MGAVVATQVVAGAKFYSFMVDCVRAAHAANTLAFAHYPEDLGTTQWGTPASLWQWADVKQLSELLFSRAAFYTSEWAPVAAPGPTGFIANAKKLLLMSAVGAVAPRPRTKGRRVKC